MEDNKNNKKKGFTLIEVLAVISILAVIVVIAIVAINGVDKNVDKIGQTISKESILKAASNYANEYLINSNVWSEEKNIDNKINEIYCVNVQTLVKYGFLPKEVKNNDAIKIIKDENQKITTKIVENDDECDVSIPIITIDIENNATFDEIAKFNLYLEPAIAGGKINYSDFYYTIYNESNNEIVKVDCGKNKTSCSGTFNEKLDDNYYGKYKVIGTVARNVNNYNTVERDFTINELTPNITLIASGTKGNNNYYISTINVTSKVDDNNKFNFDKICVFDNEIDASSDKWNNECIAPNNLDDNYSNKYVCARYEIKSRPGKYKTKCEKYLIDTKLPSITLSNNNSTDNSINVKATINDDYSDGVKYVIVDNSVSNVCNNNNFINVTSNSIEKSYTSGNNNYAIWLKDNAGNCKKKASFGYSIETKYKEVKDDNSYKYLYITTPNNINNFLYKYTDNNYVNYSNTSNKITIQYTPKYYKDSTEREPYSCNVNATFKSNADSTTNYTNCTCNSPYHKVSGNMCTYGSLGKSYNGFSKYYNVAFYCTCKNNNCQWSYKDKPKAEHINVNDDGSCYTGWKSTWNTNDNPSLTACTKAEENTSKIVNYEYQNLCEWITDYFADCEESQTYSCKSGYLYETKCYYCPEGKYVKSTNKCSKTCYDDITYKIYKYGRHAILYSLDI